MELSLGNSTLNYTISLADNALENDYKSFICFENLRLFLNKEERCKDSYTVSMILVYVTDFWYF